MSEFIDPEAALEARLEHIVDTEGLSYDDARRKLGMEAPDNSDFTAEAIAGRLGPAAMGEFDEPDETETEESAEPHDESNPKYGLNHESWSQYSKDPVVRRRIIRGVIRARRAIAEHKDD